MATLETKTVMVTLIENLGGDASFVWNGSTWNLPHGRSYGPALWGNQSELNDLPTAVIQKLSGQTQLISVEATVTTTIPDEDLEPEEPEVPPAEGEGEPTPEEPPAEPPADEPAPEATTHSTKRRRY